MATFSILERIDVGETVDQLARKAARQSAFSILERIDVGETWWTGVMVALARTTFSILERIDVGETSTCRGHRGFGGDFQYPRTDRRG